MAVGMRSWHYNDVIMSVMVSQITSLMIVYSTFYSGEDQRKHQSSTSLAFVWRIHRWPLNSRHKWPVTRKMFPFDDVIMLKHFCCKGQSIELMTILEISSYFLFRHGEVITSHSIMWDVIIHPYPRYLILSHKPMYYHTDLYEKLNICIKVYISTCLYYISSDMDK